MTSFSIPEFETERLILRAPRIEDAPYFRAFYNSDRSKYVGGPVQEATDINRALCAIMGLWAFRGYSLHVGVLKDDPSTPLGAFGTYNPLHWPEPELGWSLWDGKHEGKGYVTEALRTLRPWAYETVGVDSFASYIDEVNTASIHVAKALGATFDAEATKAANQPGAPFYDHEDCDVHVYRHRKEHQL